MQVVDHGLRRNCDRIDFLGEKGSGKDQTIILRNQSYKDIKHLGSKSLEFHSKDNGILPLAWPVSSEESMILVSLRETQLQNISATALEDDDSSCSCLSSDLV